MKWKTLPHSKLLESVAFSLHLQSDAEFYELYSVIYEF